MANRIKILDSLLASKIAAGEVVERPASVVKELIENSLDAGAAWISVFLVEGGKRLIRVNDNGCGMSRDDALLVFGRHATSKISTEEDLNSIKTLGFRGEALYSMAAVARVVLRTKERGRTEGVKIAVEAGSGPAVSIDGCPEGTSVIVQDIFSNTPARLKFLRSNETEFARVLDVFKRLALIHPEKRFSLTHGEAKVMDLRPGTRRERICEVFGYDIAGKLIEVNTPFVSGFAGSHELAYPTTKNTHLYINNRSVRDRTVLAAIRNGFGTLIGHTRYPFAVLNIILPPEDFDVNIHPSKSEVRFKNPRFVYDAVESAIRAALASPSGMASGAAAYTRHEQVLFGGIRCEEEPFNYPATIQPKLGFVPTAEGVKNPEFLGIEAIGALWGEFLIAQTPAEQDREAVFYIIDQHGASERYAFEMLKKSFYDGGKLRAQFLLVPESIDVSYDEADALKTGSAHLSRLGFEAAEFGAPSAGMVTFLIKSAPEILSSKECARLVVELAEEIASKHGSRALEAALEGALMRIACHSVIRGKRPLEKEEAAALLERLACIDFSSYCPHGRPVVKKVSRKELEAFFKRT
ncbi:MAG: DNA mismatch repair endonuclease MutL [Deltaproteobacteria bacterium]|nr:DNA mismatch repair endonuclease MutL [Deltaproteobacteria bacterium]